MNLSRKIFTQLILSVTLGGSINAQDTFDLFSQRSESQNVLKVTGQKLNNPYPINPQPRHISIDDSQKISTKDIKIKTLSGFKVANEHKVKSVSGAYSLVINNDGATIVGYDDKGLFYGRQTLNQLLSNANELPYIEINDYPDLLKRGIVEGFYGTPWSHQTRLSIIKFCGENKMNTYVYGPKDDTYHSTPNWRLPYPETEAKNIKELVRICNNSYVDFVWAIHPGKDIQWNEKDYQNLLTKFESMYELGVRSFSIFFDDISGEGTNPLKQTELLNKLNKDFVQVKQDVGSLIVCPTDYNKSWANPTLQGSLAVYGETLNPDIEVFWTGDMVCSDLTKETMDWVNTRIKRPALYWWNFPVTDYAKYVLMQGPAYGLDTILTDNDVSGILSNPMEHGEASKLALFGVADYSWNIAAYNPLDNWERAFETIAPEVKDAYRTFAINSTDTKIGYRRDESWDTETFRLVDLTEDKYNKLYPEFDKIEKVPETMSACQNKGLLNEMQPWLVEFGKLGKRGKSTLELMKAYPSANNEQFWDAYLSNLMSPADIETYKAYRSGTLKLQPFYENAMNDMLLEFYYKIANKKPSSVKAIGTFANITSPSSKLMLDSDTTTYYYSEKGQRDGYWVGVDLGKVEDVSCVSILQGRYVNDKDYFENVTLESSVDGKNWTPMLENLEKVYAIHWEGAPIKARYVRLKRLDSKKMNWIAIRSFDVNPKSIEELSIMTDDTKGVLSIFDEDPTTSYISKEKLSFKVPKDISEYIILQKPVTPIEIIQYDAKGNKLEESISEKSLLQFKLHKEVDQLEIVGSTEIFEIISVAK